jgi:hypothetical protein
VFPRNEETGEMGEEGRGRREPKKKKSDKDREKGSEREQIRERKEKNKIAPISRELLERPKKWAKTSYNRRKQGI